MALKKGANNDKIICKRTSVLCAFISFNAGEYVYVYDNGSVSRRRIATGAEFSDGAEILCGIDENDKVILSPESIYESSFVRLEE